MASGLASDGLPRHRHVSRIVLGWLLGYVYVE